MRGLSPEMISELHEIEQENGGLLPPEEVYEVAQDEDSALHDYSGFKWDIVEAAAAWNRAVVNKLIGVYVTIVQSPIDAPIEMRAYATIVDAVGERNYKPTSLVLIEDRVQLILAVLDRCESHISKYSVRELRPVQEAIDLVRWQIMHPPPPPPPPPYPPPPTPPGGGGSGSGSESGGSGGSKGGRKKGGRPELRT